MLVIVIWTVALALTLGWAAWRGGRDERVTVVALLLADIAARLHHPRPGWRNLDPIAMALDGLLLAFFLHRALVTTRWWPLYACAAQLGSTLGVGGYLTSALRLPQAYFWNSAMWSYLILGALALGVGLERQRVIDERLGRELG